MKAIKFAAIFLLTLALSGIAARNEPDLAQEKQSDSLAGRLLVATSDLSGGFFAESVIYIIEHDKRGAFGLLVNRSLGVLQLKPLFEKLGFDASDAEGEVFARVGGPVEPGAAFILHTNEVPSPGGKEIGSGLALTTEPTILKMIGKGEGPKGYLFAFGYTGWAPGQLEDEIARGSWVDVPAEPALLFDENDSEKWKAATNKLEFKL